MSKFTKNRTYTGILPRCGLCMMMVCCCVADAYALSCDTDIANAIGNNAGTASYTGNIFTVDYGSNGAITGKVQCSSQSGTNNNNTWSDPTMSDNLPDSSGSNCYCKLESYTPNGGTPQTLSGKWVFNLNMGSGCSAGCIQRCSDFFKYTQDINLKFRDATVCHSLESTTPALYTVGPGEYLPAGTEDTAPCTAGNYCPGLSEPVPYDANNDQGLEACPLSHSNSEVGSNENTNCYRTCTIGDVPHSTSTVNGGVYYNGIDGDGVNACEPTDCTNGWHFVPGFNLTSIIGETPVVADAYINGYYHVYNESGTNYGQDFFDLDEDDTGAFAVYFGDKGIIHGHAACSTTQKTTFSIEPSLIDQTGTEDAMYCWCRLDGYTPNNGTLQNVSSVWVSRSSFSHGSNCAAYCASDCGTNFGWIPYREALFNATESTLASCKANTITINWNGTTQDAINANNADTVEYGGDIRTPQFAIHIPGKVFKGWRFSATPEN